MLVIVQRPAFYLLVAVFSKNCSKLLQPLLQLKLGETKTNSNGTGDRSLLIGFQLALHFPCLAMQSRRGQAKFPNAFKC